jgi:hypothetical protein
MEQTKRTWYHLEQRYSRASQESPESPACCCSSCYIYQKDEGICTSISQFFPQIRVPPVESLGLRISRCTPAVRCTKQCNADLAYSMEQIRKEGPCSRKILNTIAFFDNKRLPFQLIRAAAGPTFSEDEILLAASRLTEYSFLLAQRAADEGLPTYEHHRLVHLAAHRSLTKTQTISFSGESILIMSDLFPAGTHVTWIDCTLYLPHALKAARGRKQKGTRIELRHSYNV